MASLANTIRTFQSGALSRNEFLDQVDRALASDQGDSTRLLEVLKKEHTNFPLPPDMYAEVQRRIEHCGEVKAGQDDDEDITRVQFGPAQRTVPPKAAAPPPVGGGKGGDDPDRIKGVGDTLNGRFVLEECLGFGGMGMVYKALDLRKQEASDRNPYIAIKVLNVQFRGHPKSLIALQREAKKAQKLAHPNIVTVYDFDRDGSMVYLTMEYLEGKPLSQLLRSADFKGMSFRRVLQIITGIGKALSYAHERGFVHCDLKPANVFVTDNGEVKVIDFGIARVFQRPEEETEATVFDAGSLGGLTPAYASPEMIEHQEPDPKDDIYALGCITYELLTGRHPFNRLPATQARSAGMKPLRPKGIGLKQWRALRTALCFKREERMPTVNRFLREMTGEQPAIVTYAALMGSGFLLAGLISAAFVYYWNFRPKPAKEPDLPVASAPSEPELAESRPADSRPAQSGPAGPKALDKVQPQTQPQAAETPKPAPVGPPSLASITPLLAQVPCSALLPSLKGNMVEVQGYLSVDYGVDRLKQLLGSAPGVKSVKANVIPVRGEQCSVVSSFAPYWLGNRQADGATSIHTKAPKGQLKEGDPLILNIATPAYESYVNIDYYVLDGSVVHLVPSPRAPDNQAPPRYSATIGGLGTWVISKPFGSEMIVLLATPVPLFDQQRPENESRADYLKAVESRLGQIAGQYGRDKITADFVQITTRARTR